MVTTMSAFGLSGSVALIFNAMALSSSPATFPISSTGVASGTSTGRSIVTDLVTSEPSRLDVSVAVAVTFRLKSVVMVSGTKSLRLSNAPPSRLVWEIVHEPSRLSVPALRLAPAGIPETVIDNVSEPSVSVKFDVMPKSNVVVVPSSTPAPRATLIVGASATATILDVALSPAEPPSVVVAEADRSIVPFQLAGGVSSMVPSWVAGSRVSEPVTSTVKLSVPTVRVAPSGKPDKVTAFTDSAPLKPSAMFALRFMVMDPSSVPSVVVRVTTGASAAGAILDVALSPAEPPSVVVAEADRSIVPFQLAGGVSSMVPSWVAGSRVSEPVTSTVKLSVPTVRVAPSGKPDKVTAFTDSAPLKPSAMFALRFMVMDPSSVPSVVVRVTTGASAVAPTLTVTALLTVALPP